ncbi:MAG TPA: hypothetical protein VIX11_01040 [Candidatus Acidoferrum sp.]
MTAISDKNVGGLDVAVDYSFGVRRVECVGNVDTKREKGFQFHGKPGDAVLQGLPLEKFHGDERLPVLVVDFVNGADVGVIPERKQPGLRAESG